ncbi:MAG: hypothetical protein KDK44_00340 [Chlamydiia bacterium]|nr:hypothetical protein [Chlamydiia bacterium]
MDKRTGIFLSALFLTSVLLARPAAPKTERTHRSSIDAIPGTLTSIFSLQNDSRLHNSITKAVPESSLVYSRQDLPSGFIVTQVHSCPPPRLLVPSVHLEIADLTSVSVPKIQFSKQFSIPLDWSPPFTPTMVLEKDTPTSTQVYKENNISHQKCLQRAYFELDKVQSMTSPLKGFQIDQSVLYTFTYPTYKKPKKAFSFRGSSIDLTSAATIPKYSHYVPDAFDPIYPDLQESHVALSEHICNGLPIIVRIPPPQLQLTAYDIPFHAIAFNTQAITHPKITLKPRHLPVAVDHGFSTHPLKDASLHTLNPHMQPEKTYSFSLSETDHTIPIFYNSITIPSLPVDTCLAHQAAQSMLRHPTAHRVILHAFKNPQITAKAPSLQSKIKHVATDAELDYSYSPNAESSQYLTLLEAENKQPFTLDSLPLSIAFPTLNDLGFIFKKEHLLPVVTSLSPDHFPKYCPSTVNRHALIEMTDMPLSHLVKNIKRSSTPACMRPHLIEDACPEWIHQSVHLPTIVLEPSPSIIPVFAVNNAPDPRALYRYSKTLPKVRLASLAFHSDLIETIELPYEVTIIAATPKSSFFLPSKEILTENTIRCETYGDLLPGCPLLTTQYRLPVDHLDLATHLILATDPILHPASSRDIAAQLQASLIVEANHQQTMSKKRLTSDEYIRKYGYFPTPEASVLAVATTATPSPMFLDPLPSIEPYLWTDPSLSEDIASHINFAEKKHQRRSDILNRKHRVTATNLARIPTLFDLETTSLNQEFSTSVSWAPKAEDGKYLFAITVKPIENTHFERLEQNIYFVIDNTQSINKAKAAAYKSAILRALPYVHKADTFNIFTIDDALHAMSATNLTSASGTKALVHEYLDKQKFFHPYKTSNVYAQLLNFTKALAQAPGLHTVFFFTDGSSLLDLSKTLTDIHALIDANKTTFNLYPVCVGNDNHTSFIQMLSTLQRGEVMHSATMAAFPRKFAGFVKKLQTPIARDLHAIVMPTDPNAHCKLFSESPRLPAFYSGKPLVIYGETDTLSDLNLMIQGRFGSSFVNITKKIAFTQNAQVTATFRKEGARFQAATYFLEFLQSKETEPLAKTNSLIMRYGGRKLL